MDLFLGVVYALTLYLAGATEEAQATVSEGPLVWIYPERVEESVPSDLLLRLLLLVHLTFLIPHVLAAIIAHQR